MKYPYSRLQSVEEKRNTKKAFLFIFLTIAVVLLLVVAGIPALGRLTVFISDLRGANKVVTKTDGTPPAPPKFNYFSSFTNQQTTSISGTSEPGATVKLTFDENSEQTLVDKDGNFNFSFNLVNGDNTLSAIAVDTAGNQSQKTSDYKITYDNTPPSLTVNSPSDGTSFFGSNQRQVTIEGATDANCQIVINDRIISVNDSGNFQYTTTLNDGANTFAVKSTDQAGNTTEKDITLNFTP